MHEERLQIDEIYNIYIYLGICIEQADINSWDIT